MVELECIWTSKGFSIEARGANIAEHTTTFNQALPTWMATQWQPLRKFLTEQTIESLDCRVQWHGLALLWTSQETSKSLPGQHLVCSMMSNFCISIQNGVYGNDCFNSSRSKPSCRYFCVKFEDTQLDKKACISKAVVESMATVQCNANAEST